MVLRGMTEIVGHIFVLKCAIEWRNHLFFFLIGKWCDTGGAFCQFLFQKCVLGKVKQHFDHVMMKSSSENNANELPWNSFSSQCQKKNNFFSSQLTPVKEFLNRIGLKVASPPCSSPLLHHCTKWAAGAPVAGARLYQGRGTAAAWHLSAPSTRGDYSVLTSKEVCLTWAWRCASRASPWSSLAVLISPPQTFSAFCCNTAAR